MLHLHTTEGQTFFFSEQNKPKTLTPMPQRQQTPANDECDLGQPNLSKTALRSTLKRIDTYARLCTCRTQNEKKTTFEEVYSSLEYKTVLRRVVFPQKVFTQREIPLKLDTRVTLMPVPHSASLLFSSPVLQDPTEKNKNSRHLRPRRCCPS